MDIGSQQSQVTSDDQELAKVLAGISTEPEETPFLETGAPTTPPPMPSLDESSVDESEVPAETTTPAVETPVVTAPAPVMPIVAAPAQSDDLTSIKSNALNELRPLVDKLSLSPEEMFDAYLLLIRSTDDKTLIAPAYQAAHSITDEAKRAKALLEVVKEIDYLNSAA